MFKKHRRVILACIIGAFALLLSWVSFPKSHKIEINSRGFSPAEITIQAGDTVTWKSVGGNYWPASNSHPNHQEYPESGGCIGSQLDACKPIPDGQSYSYRFSKSGIWGIHDHLSPGLSMTVKVKSRWATLASPVTKVAGWFKRDDNIPRTDAETLRLMDQSKQRAYITQLAEDNPKQAWELLKAAFIINGQVTANVHDFAHMVGNSAFRKSGVEGINICDPAFAHGCYHGVTEEALKKNGSSAVAGIEKACTDAIGRSAMSEALVGCMHGMGHGILSNQKYVLHEGLNGCEMLSRDYRSFCYDGVFMEFANGSPNIVIDPENPWKLCSGIQPVHEYACSKYMPTVLAIKGHGLRPGQVCKAAPNPNMQMTCFSAVGYQMAQISQGDPEKIKSSCVNAAPEDTEQCVIGAAHEVAFQRYGDWSGRVESLCNAVRVEKRSECLRK
jgi:plastocyanin